MRRRRIPREKQHDSTPTTIDEMISRYEARYPKYISDVAYIREYRAGV